MKKIAAIKLSAGVLSVFVGIIFSIFRVFQDFSFLHLLEYPSRTVPLLIACCFLFSGILSILTRNGNRLNADVVIYNSSFTCIMFYFTSAILGYKYAGNYHGFNFWTIFSILFGMFYVFLMKYEKEQETA
jgi:hypothetical protein